MVTMKSAVVPRLAVCNKRLQIRNELELVEVGLNKDRLVTETDTAGREVAHMVTVPDIDPVTGMQKTEVVPTWIPVYAETGTVIDVSEWANAASYVSHGSITMLSPTEAKEAWALMQAEAEAAELEKLEAEEAMAAEKAAQEAAAKAEADAKSKAGAKTTTGAKTNGS